ncbi:lytic transglycosylase domain-containing protein (plasmid) [Roseomonas mucosa]|uniref:lytic transglycosylase domain-containing protein n=1 Tax=Roseomonas mucosa TaxID=207340 RepID=UPI0030CAB56E
MRATLLAAAILPYLLVGQARADDVSDATVAAVTDCIRAAAALHRVPPGVIAVLLAVEGGSIGRTSGNTNGTVDIGPMQINEIHLPAIARRWGTSVAAARSALLNNFCANVEAGAWILRTALDSAGGDFWEGVGRYHSRTEVYKGRYLRQVLTQVLRLRDRASGTGSRGVP